MLAKYWSVLKISWQDALEYRTEFFISFLGWLIRLLISIFLFSAIFKETGEIGGFDLKETILYFVVIQIIITLIFSRIGFMIGLDIQKGDLSNYLVKPMAYMAFQALRQLARNLMHVSLGIVIFGIAFAIFEPSFFERLTATQLSLTFVCITLAYVLNMSMASIIGLSAFWITNSSRLIYMFYAILSIFSGLMIPINFFPEFAQKILFNTPFPYIFYIPTQALLGHITWENYAPIFEKGMVFSLIAIALVYIVFKLGIKKYEAVGN